LLLLGRLLGDILFDNVNVFVSDLQTGNGGIIVCDLGIGGV